MEVYPCPLCGCTLNRHGEPFDSPQRVVEHIDGAKDDKHKRESGSDYLHDIQDNQMERNSEEFDAGYSDGCVSHKRTIVSCLTGEKYTITEYSEVVDSHLETAIVERRELREEIADLREEIADLRKQVEGG